ncbi:MAG: hypothetical protein E5X53_02455 [Mesorhizobium sp.]|nr:MAG: hypothetical protein E5X55_08065 [Mesorhizobium sp.]TIQ15036.1 MAG: hypothetical protein E5X57_00170 [Mesorhizobium sp.]TIR53875.1 MAG: hypothetical protein E5X53_02455 [Mesorhizobium sp.]TJW00135.1 MAG: hypothetical protein E5X52_00170 [Mesorhizobium sp.]
MTAKGPSPCNVQHSLRPCFRGLAPLSAYGQGEDMPGKRMLQRVDTNGDGAISKDEMLAARERMFTKLDRNDDGVIDEKEIEGARDAIMDRRRRASCAWRGPIWRRRSRLLHSMRRR